MPGAYPGSENPYKATHPLDPRVDGGRASDRVASPSTSTSTHHGTAGSGTAGVGAGTGAAALGASQGLHRDKPAAVHEPSGPAPSTLTTTRDPAARSGEYSEPSRNHGLDSVPTAAGTGTMPSTWTTNADPSNRSPEYSESVGNKGLDSTATTNTTATGTSPRPGQEQDESMVNKVLDAVGLTGAVGAASAALGLSKKDETMDEPRDTSPIATHPGQVSQEAGPPQHYRRESIPTTAYPAGLNSPRAVAPPVGGTQPLSHHTEQPSHLGRDAGLAAGTGALAGHEFDRSRAVPENVTRETGNTAPTAVSGLASGTAASGLSNEQYRDSHPAHENISSHSETRPRRGTFHDLTTSPQQPGTEESHAGRNAALGGATAAAVGAGAYGLHEHNRQEPTALPQTRDRDTAVPSQPSAVADTTTIPDRTASHNTYTISNKKDPIDAVAAAPDRYEDQAAKPSHGHTTAAAAGATGAGAATAAAIGHGHGHEHEHGHERGLEHGHEHGHVHEHPPHAYEVPYDTHEPALFHRPGAAAVGHSADAQAERDRARHAWEVQNRQRQEREAAAAAAGTGAGIGAATSAHGHDSSAREIERHTPTTTGAPIAAEAHHGHHNKPWEVPYGTHETANYNRVGGAALDHTTSAQEERDRARHASEMEDQRRREREAAAAAGTGAVAGGAAYAAHEHGERDERKHQKELEKEEKKHQKELEKDEKKHHRELERDEKKHHKELEKEEKAHHKEHDKAVAAAEERERARIASQEEDRRRREREAATAAGVTGAAGAGAATHEHDRRAVPEEQGEKKPSIFKRIGRKILRRKNKDTGEDEEYSTDEDEPKTRHSAEYGSHVPKHESASKGRTVLGPSYEEASGGAQKPSYNPLHKDKPLLASSDPSGTGPTTALEAHDSRPTENISGVPYDSHITGGHVPNTGISGGPIGGGMGSHETEAPGTRTGGTTTTHTIGSGTHTSTSTNPHTGF